MEYNIRFTLDFEIKQNFTELIKYHKNSDYFNSTDDELKKKYKTRIDNIKVSDKLGDTGMNLLEIPARKVLKTTNKDYPVSCPLCLNPMVDKTIYPYNLEKLLLWRGYLIKPNTFPYFKVHYLIQSSDHDDKVDRGTQNEVHKNPNVIDDMILLSKLMKEGSILFNGWIGNSLGHLHFHYTDTNFNVKTKIKDYVFDKEIIETRNDTKVTLYKDEENNCKNFVLFKGTNTHKDVFEFLQYLDMIKLLYNILIFHKDETAFVYVFIRKKDQDEYNFNFGSAHMSGLSTFSDDNLKIYKDNKKHFLKIIDNYCSKTLVKMNIDMIKKLFS